MKNAKWNSIDEFDDISTKDQYQIAREAGLSDREAMEACNRMSRDNARTPMQWTSGENAGFTKGTAWLKTILITKRSMSKIRKTIRILF